MRETGAFLRETKTGWSETRAFLRETDACWSETRAFLSERVTDIRTRTVKNLKSIRFQVFLYII
jgi:hypothetical protein